MAIGSLGLSSLSLCASSSGEVVEQFIQLADGATAPTTSILSPGQALDDTAGWSGFIDVASYETTAPGEAIASASVNYLGSTASASEAFADGDTNAFSITVTDSGGNSRTFSTLSRVVVNIAPVASNALADQSFDRNTGTQTYDTSGDFTGADLVFSIAPTLAGMTIDAATGVASFDTATLSLMSSTSIVVTATNSGGSAASAFGLSITAGLIEDGLAPSGQSNTLSAGISDPTTPPANFTTLTQTQVINPTTRVTENYVAGTNSGDSSDDVRLWSFEAQIAYRCEQASLRPVMIGKTAKGGSGLAQVGPDDWNAASTNELADRQLATCIEIIDAVEAKGSTFGTLYIPWCQGENTNAAGTYRTEFEALKAHLESGVEAAHPGTDVQWILVRLRYFDETVETEVIQTRQAMEGMANDFANVTIVDSDFEDFTQLHPGRDWIDGVGDRIFERMHGDYDAVYGAIQPTGSITNDAPAATDDTAVVLHDTATVISVLGNDTDPENDALTITAVSVPSNGTAAINGGTTITYTPNAGYAGADSFTYTIDDGNGNTDTATVNVTVSAASGGGYRADTQAFSDQNDVSGGTALTTAQKDAIDAFYATKAGSTWDASIYRLFVPGMPSLIASTIDMVDPTRRATLVDAGTAVAWTQAGGWNASGVTGAGYDLGADTSTLWSSGTGSFGAWLSNVTDSTSFDIISDSNDSLLRVRDASTRTGMSSGGIETFTGLTNQPGLHTVSRTVSGSYDYYEPDGTTDAAPDAFSTPTDTAFVWGAYSTSRTPSDRGALAVFVGDGLTAAEVSALNTALGLLITALSAVETTPVEVTDLTFSSGDPVAGAFNILEDATVHFVIDTVETGATPEQVADGDNTLDAAADYAWSEAVTAPSGTITGTFPDGLNGGYYLKAVAELADGTLSTAVAVAGPVTINTLVTPPSYDEDFQTDPYVGTYESEALFPTTVDGTAITLTQDTTTDGSSTLAGSSLGRLSFAGASSGYSRIEIPVDGSTAFVELVVRWGNTSGSSSLSRNGRMFWMDASKSIIGSTFNIVNLGAQQFSKAIYNGDQAPSLGSMPATARYLAIEVNVSNDITSFLHDLEFNF